MFWEVLLDALLDSAKVLPFLLIIYIIIELIEEKASTQVKFLKYTNGKYATLMGSGIGLIPQCGFSVVASSLFSKKYISMGTLLAIFIATSDEAIPIILSSSGNELKILPILVIKFLFALVVGYGTSFVIYLISKNKMNHITLKDNVKTNSKNKNTKPERFCKGNEHKTKSLKISDNAAFVETSSQSISITEETEEIIKMGESACCGHNVESKKKTFTSFIVHPMIHSLKIFAYILIINLALGLLIYFVGEKQITTFLQSLHLWQPLLIPIFGLIPNCASSVLITQLYLIGGINFGACVAGLCVNAGLGIAVLLKQNKNWKQNVTIISILYFSSVILGYFLTLVNIKF